MLPCANRKAFHSCPLAKMVSLDTVSDTTIRSIPSKYQHDLLWSLQPVLNSMRILGMDLDVGLPRSKIRRYAFLVYEMFLALFVVASTIIFELQPDSQNGQSKIIQNWQLWLITTTTSLSAILLQLTSFIMVVFQWKSLWKKVRKLDDNLLSMHTSFPGKLRKVSIVLLAIAVTLVIFFFSK